VAAVREALGPEMALAIDAVQNYNPKPWSVKEAARMLRILEPFNLAWAEEMFATLRSTAVRRTAARDVNAHLGRRGHHDSGAVRAVAARRGFRPGTTRRDDHRRYRRGASGMRGGRGRAALRWLFMSGGSAPTLAANVHLLSPRPTAFGSSIPFWATRSNPSCSSIPRSFARVLCGRRRPRDSASGIRLTAELRDKYRFVPAPDHRPPLLPPRSALSGDQELPGSARRTGRRDSAHDRVGALRRRVFPLLRRRGRAGCPRSPWCTPFAYAIRWRRRRRGERVARGLGGRHLPVSRPPDDVG
jgi:enolase-like protein